MELCWRFILTTCQPAKVDKVVNRLKLILGEDCILKNKVPYWKDSSQTEIVFLENYVGEQTISEIIVILLRKLSCISNDWNMIIPNDIANNVDDFSGICNNNIKINNVHWASFLISQEVGAL